MEISRGFLIMLKANKQKGFYVLEGEKSPNTVAVVSHHKDKSIIWHKHMDHVSDHKLQLLSKEGLLGDDKVTSVLVKLPFDAKVVGCKWLYKLKEGIESAEPTKYKTRPFTQGYTQVEGMNYNEIFSPW